MLVADVSGHGASAALTSAMIKTAFSRAAIEADGPAALLSDVQRDLSSVTQTTQFITAVGGLFDPGQRTLRLTSAGHPYPVLVRGGAAATVNTANEVPLLIEPEQDYRRQTIVNLRAGDRVLYYTDGATEAPGAEGQMLEIEGLLRMVEANAQTAGQAFVNGIMGDIRRFTNGRLRDDVALLCLEVKSI